MNFIKKDISDFNVNPFKMIGKDWYLITSANSPEDYNTMTASWGAFGEMWGKHMFTCAVRPNRHTYGYIDNSENEYFSISFFDEKYRDMLNFCGTKSGRDYDKAKETGITPVVIDGTVAFEEAHTVIVCRKMFSQDMNEESFIDKDALKFYEKDPFHRMYISEVMAIYQK
ncbi:MAG: flavin reductase [Oscillospiraceae bacterium]|nr:flavin reductase [Oscillospiraceae bacterium]MBQ9982593.1 flavin reductase [Oscillospiraceae bacterium]MBR6598897.1 flavin reductase [Oscillospiraceae bacterium]